jgi:single-stranded-DNA-specific exonuclease
VAELLSLTGKRWIEPLTLVLDGRQSLSQRIAMERGLLAPPAQGTYPAMQQATERVHRAIASGECVGLFGDYDCDGITSAAQLVRFFRRQNIEPVVRLPHRVHDGYGLQQESVEWFATQKVTLLITVDTGIASVTEVEQANSLGIDVIVTDHHRPAENIPNAFAILHPSLSPNFPKPHPSGAGVVYDFLFALEHGQWEGKESDCALAMIGTVADLVPLLGRNRVLVQRGLECLQQLSNCPLADMRDRTKTASSTDVAFRIAPRINAAGRIDDPLIGLRALLEGGEALSQLDALNEHRQTLMRQCVDDAIRGIADPDSAFLLWTASSEYPHGIIGLLRGDSQRNMANLVVQSR